MSHIETIPETIPVLELWNEWGIPFQPTYLNTGPTAWDGTAPQDSLYTSALVMSPGDIDARGRASTWHARWYQSNTDLPDLPTMPVDGGSVSLRSVSGDVTIEVASQNLRPDRWSRERRLPLVDLHILLQNDQTLSNWLATASVTMSRDNVRRHRNGVDITLPVTGENNVPLTADITVWDGEVKTVNLQAKIHLNLVR